MCLGVMSGYLHGFFFLYFIMGIFISIGLVHNSVSTTIERLLLECMRFSRIPGKLMESGARSRDL